MVINMLFLSQNIF